MEATSIFHQKAHSRPTANPSCSLLSGRLITQSFGREFQFKGRRS